jgi:hypothetical protein
MYDKGMKFLCTVGMYTIYCASDRNITTHFSERNDGAFN